MEMSSGDGSEDEDSVSNTSGYQGGLPKISNKLSKGKRKNGSKSNAGGLRSGFK